MKKLVFFIAVMLIAQVSFTQIFSWGLKAGVNSTKISFDDFSIGDPTVTIDPASITEPDFFIDVNGTSVINPDYITVNAPEVQFSPKSYEMGYHFGAFARIKLLGIFLQTELYFSQTQTQIDFNERETLAGDLKSSTANIKYNNFDIPVLVGIKLGPARFNLGPVASFKLDPKVEGAKDQVKESLNSFSSATELATFGG